ncbi:MAG TPA: ATP-binding protein [Pseudonocardiaceae bacterium]|nr:ATP-binding protein [Pseudonocardiaceae bacterium]
MGNDAPPTGKEPVMSFEVRAAATPIVIPTIRTIAADLAARADFDLDSIDDLRMAVDDVCAMLVGIAAEDGTLSCTFTLSAERIELSAEVDADHLIDPLPTGSFDRRVLECLVDEVRGLLLRGTPNSGEPPISTSSMPRAAGGKVRISLAKSVPAAPSS